MINKELLSIISDVKAYQFNSNEMSTLVMTDVNDVLSPRVELIYPNDYKISLVRDDLQLKSSSSSSLIELSKVSGNDIDVLTMSEPEYFSSITPLHGPYTCRSSQGDTFAAIDCEIIFTRKFDKEYNDRFTVKCSILADLDSLNVQDRVFVYFDHVDIELSKSHSSRIDQFTHKMIAIGLASSIAGRVSFDTPKKSIKTGFGIIYPSSIDDTVKMSKSDLELMASFETARDHHLALNRMIKRGPVAGRDDVTVEIIDHQYIVNSQSKSLNDFEASQLEEYILSGAADEIYSRNRRRGKNV